ncbi:hypothetical protein AYO44_16250 [Planctomycetaceae bacterium SCGC AG-212-F19]|nr:hypothetical protein AYO44_16250 [Planctomycetaceae bacterium SCGC AG-212-F19]
MIRILLCLPLCLCLGSDRPNVEPAVPAAAAARADVVKDTGAALPSAAEMEKLARTDPVAFLENCIRRCVREVKGYSLTLQKQENIAGKIQPSEIVQVHFREKPHSVFFNWVEGARLAERVLYVEGENDGKMLARPKGGLARIVAGDVTAREVNGPDARNSARYTMDQFGFKKSTERTLLSWKTARDAGTLNVEYLGRSKVKEVGDKECYILKRIAKEPENDGVKESLYYFDSDTWLQVGVVLKDDKGLLIGSYYFRDLKLNPEFKKDQFTPAALKPS